MSCTTTSGGSSSRGRAVSSRIRSRACRIALSAGQRARNNVPLPACHPSARRPARQRAGALRTRARSGPAWPCQCRVRRCWRAPPPTRATGRPCGRPCPTARETGARNQPWPPGTACAAGHAPHPAENFGRRRDQPANRHSPGTPNCLSTHRRSRGPSLTAGYVARPAQAVLRPPPTPTRPAPTSRLITGYRSRRSTRTPQPGGPGRASPVPAVTICTFRAPYAGGSLTAAPSGSSPLPWPSPYSSGLGIPSSPPSGEIG